MAAPAAPSGTSPSNSPSLSTSPSPTTTPTTAATPTTTSTPPPTTTHAETSTPSVSLITVTSPTSSASSTQSSSTTALTSSPGLSSIQSSTPAGAVITTTSFILASSTSTPQTNAASSNNSFFHNTGAVAGVFTVVGLIVAGLIIALVINAVRRRRAEKFDRDVAEAAAEAAASSRSPFDDYNNGGGGAGGGGGGYGYSDNSHGTYQLPPASPPNDAYGMSEMSQYDPYAAGAASLVAANVGRSRSRKDSEPGAPGIAGVGAGSLAREPSKRAPYHAFAGPGPQPHELQLQPSNGTFRNRRSNQDVLEAAGLAAIANNAYPGNGGNVTRQLSDTQHTLDGRSKFGSVSSGGHHPLTLQPGYPIVDSYYPQRNDSLSPDPFAGYPPITAPSKPLPNPHDAPSVPATVPSPSPPVHQPEHIEDHGESGSRTGLRSDEQRMSYQDDTDYSQRNRVLRVANE